MSFLFSSMYLEPDDLAAIGRVVVESAYCEHAVDEIIWALCGLNEDKGRLLTSVASHDRKLDVMLQLWRPTISPQGASELVNIVRGLKEANSQRNDIMHGLWTAAATRFAHGLAMLASANPPARKPPFAENRRLKTGPTTIGIEQATPLAERIGGLTIELLDLANASGLLRPSS